MIPFYEFDTHYTSPTILFTGAVFYTFGWTVGSCGGLLLGDNIGEGMRVFGDEYTATWRRGNYVVVYFGGFSYTCTASKGDHSRILQ